MWLSGITIELGMQSAEPTVEKCDNKGAIDLGKNARFSPRTKDISVRHHFVKEQVDKKQVNVQFVPSSEMTAHPLTKATPTSRLVNFVNDVGLIKYM